MKNILIIVGIVIILFISFKYFIPKEENKSAYHKISALEAKEMMEQGNVIILDVRREDEYKGGHIKNSVLVPNETINNMVLKEIPDLDKTILVYCRSGRRSKDASMKLVDIGYKNIYDFGGIIDWPYEIEK
ncbi:rhodanese-like domain-containing protein [Anaerofustis stercorihominis]|uniref:Rhodanese-like protein n=2 Tax=Anaerofustis stercorihominis TaxID=214853 RepID=B1C9U7_9FIRM|nr:rhodanese-like domain-containing protein [Anaerofustis stercorihominis]EDS72163.1 rhodanese-like protein [Anaerofustis stercorihominis DSM 17244]MCQ4795779.1 rhodanese-like domain-containing protein [Anaerofustis stercorihominis]RGD75770.1 rhodanese-like domain-containing protein [Anaerofustis stercorihominis]